MRRLFASVLALAAGCGGDPRGVSLTIPAFSIAQVQDGSFAWLRGDPDVELLAWLRMPASGGTLSSETSGEAAGDDRARTKLRTLQRAVFPRSAGGPVTLEVVNTDPNEPHAWSVRIGSRDYAFADGRVFLVDARSAQPVVSQLQSEFQIEDPDREGSAWVDAVRAELERIVARHPAASAWR
jgi:hypothetical protein